MRLAHCAIDGVDHSQFFIGNQEKSERDGFVVYFGSDLFGVTWQNWKKMSGRSAAFLMILAGSESREQ